MLPKPEFKSMSRGTATRHSIAKVPALSHKQAADNGEVVYISPETPKLMIPKPKSQSLSRGTATPHSLAKVPVLSHKQAADRSKVVYTVRAIRPIKTLPTGNIFTMIFHFIWFLFFHIFCNFLLLKSNKFN